MKLKDKIDQLAARGLVAIFASPDLKKIIKAKNAVKDDPR